MKKIPLDMDRHERSTASPLVEAVLNLVRNRVRERTGEHGLTAAIEAGQHPLCLLGREDIEGVERAILDSGYRFAWSAGISVSERPDIYRQDGENQSDFSFENPEAVVREADENGREQRGFGDNVVRHKENVIGTARYIRTNERVLEYLTHGVPPKTIAIIDDSGGTLTAPILARFTGVICAGGTTRSHLGILTREYRVPCLMNAKISGIRHGDTVCIETTAQPKTADDYQAGRETTARVWRITK